MAYIMHNSKPYYFDGTKAYPCTITGDSITVQFDKPLSDTVTPTEILNEHLIRHKLGIKMIDGWDDVEDKVIKVTNKTVTSIEQEPTVEDDEEETPKKKAMPRKLKKAAEAEETAESEKLEKEAIAEEKAEERAEEAEAMVEKAAEERTEEMEENNAK